MDFFVDPDRLQASGRAMADAGADTAVELTRLHQDIASQAAAPWADSAPLVAAYRDLTAVTEEVLTLVSAALRHGGTGLQAMADTYQHADDAAGQGFGEIKNSLRSLL